MGAKILKRGFLKFTLGSFGPLCKIVSVKIFKRPHTFYPISTKFVESVVIGYGVTFSGELPNFKYMTL